MWLFTTTGFISAVYKDDAMQIRARDKESLEAISKFLHCPIIHTPLADYPYRISTDSGGFAEWVSSQVFAIDYKDFKSEVSNVRGYEFARPLNKVSDVMHAVEDKEARLRS
jgi:hypothetical protein